MTDFALACIAVGSVLLAVAAIVFAVHRIVLLFRFLHFLAQEGWKSDE